MELATLPALLLHRVDATPDAPAFLRPAGAGWETLRWRDVGRRVRAIALGLRALGLAPGERVSILSGTRVEWLLADFAIVCAGGATTTIYPSSTEEECAFILRDSDSTVAFAENAEAAARIVSRRAELPALRRVVLFEGPGDGGFLLSLDELEALAPDDDAAFRAGVAAVRPEDLASILYTSGTTGRPKGVEATHEAWATEAWSSEAVGLVRPDDLQFFWLPLAHSFGKMMAGLQLRVGFATAVDGRIERLVDNLAAVRPTFVCAVPRIFEKVHAKMLAAAHDGGPAKEAIFRRALEVGDAVAAARRAGRAPPLAARLQHPLADRLVLSKLRARFGGRLRFFVSGSAPLSRELAEFFDAAGILILEGYGLTETCAASFLNLPGHNRFGHVGRPMPGIEVRLADDGEVLLRSKTLMRGYHRLPEATAEAIDPEGWFHTGDVGVLDDGFLRLTDRKKDLIKTSGGKYVAPQYLEGKLKTACPYLSQVLVHGDSRKFVSALVTLDEEALRPWAKEHGLEGRPVAELAADDRVRALIAGFIERVNADLASYETIRKFAILPRDLSLEAGELTASMKLRRKAVEERYGAVLDSLYDERRAAGT